MGGSVGSIAKTIGLNVATGGLYSVADAGITAAKGDVAGGVGKLDPSGLASETGVVKKGVQKVGQVLAGPQAAPAPGTPAATPLAAPGIDDTDTQARLAFARADALRTRTQARRSLLSGGGDSGLVSNPLQQARTLG